MEIRKVGGVPLRIYPPEKTVADGFKHRNKIGTEVGAVQDARLGTDATTVNIHVTIERRHAGLVRTGSKFWNASDVDVNVGLLRGLEINVESLRSLVAGGIAFVTPEDPGYEPAKDGAMFPLHEEPEKEWLEWAPKIALPPDRGASPP